MHGCQGKADQGQPDLDSQGRAVATDREAGECDAPVVGECEPTRQEDRDQAHRRQTAEPRAERRHEPAAIVVAHQPRGHRTDHQTQGQLTADPEDGRAHVEETYQAPDVVSQAGLHTGRTHPRAATHTTTAPTAARIGPVRPPVSQGRATPASMMATPAWWARRGNSIGRPSASPHTRTVET